MPASFINDPQHWRDRAEEMRRLAEEMIDEKSKQTMLRRGPGRGLLAARRLRSAYQPLCSSPFMSLIVAANASGRTVAASP
jgi:hypothetical protein